MTFSNHKMSTKLFAVFFAVAAFFFSQNVALAAITATQITGAAVTTAATTQATASFTPVASRLYLLWTIQTIGTTPPTTPTVSCANGLTMVQVNPRTFATNATPHYRLTLFRGMKASGLSAGTCTISWGQTTAGHGHIVVEFSGIDTSGADGSGAVVQSAVGSTDSATAAAGLSISLGTILLGSTTAGGFVNNDNNASALVAGTGYTAGTLYRFNTPAVAIRAEWRTAGSATVNMTQRVTSHIGGIAVEIRQPASATLSASPTTCTILSGASTCTVPFTWSISNAISPNLYNSTTATQYSTAASGSGVSFAITNGSNTVQARDSSTVLASTSVTASCTSGTTWNGSSCAVNAFTITASSGANGSVTPGGITSVSSGGSQTYNITPNSNYTVATLLIDSVSVATSTTYTFTNVQASHTISATFSVSATPTFNIVASSGANGSVTPAGSTAVSQGGSQIYNVTPDSGYAVATLVVDSVSIATSTTYTFTNVQAAHTISATFSLIPVTHTITASTGSNGTVSPLGTTVVDDGGSQAYSITPDSGYYISTLIIDSFTVATSTSYTFTNVQADHTIEATFAAVVVPPGSFSISATAGTNGSISPSGTTVVTQGGSQMYSINPNSGYDVATLTIDGSPVATSTAYTFTNVQTNHTIDATFSATIAGAVVGGGPRLARINFFGRAFPGATIAIVDKSLSSESIITQKETAKVDGGFEVTFSSVLEGVHSFALLIKDPEGRTSQTKFFLFDARNGDEVFKDIVVPPTIDVANGQVSRGDSLKIFGYAALGHTLRLYLDGILVAERLAGNGGLYSIDLPTGALEFGQHTLKAKQINLNGRPESDFSITKTFIVSKLSVVKADLSGDGKIDIQDWSIFLSRWGSKNSFGRMEIDFNNDGKIDLADFSIFIKTIRK